LDTAVLGTTCCNSSLRSMDKAAEEERQRAWRAKAAESAAAKEADEEAELAAEAQRAMSDVAPPWKAVATDGTTYYWNTETDETSWDKPAAETQVSDKQPLVCGICLDAEVDTEELVQLDCSHNFHLSCIRAQIEAKWAGPRVSFAFLGCALCRADLSGGSLAVITEAPRALREHVYQICRQRALLDGSIDGLQSMGPEQAKCEVLDKMAAYRCGRCRELFCGGTANCGTTDMDADALRCQSCAWREQSSDVRCREHGAAFAIYKCDSCCSIACYDCSGNHYCEYCHNRVQDGGRERPTCHGRPEDNCPLATWHPENVPRNHNVPKNGFVVGCTKCLGIEGACDMNAVSPATRQRFG